MNENDELARVLERVTALEARVRRVEDELEIIRLIASYGPAADSCDGDAVAGLWAEGGTYELGTWGYDRSTMHGVVESELHLRYVAAGSAHVMTLPRVTVDGDRALAVNYSTIFMHRGDQWVVDRAAANRWDLERTGEGWRVRRRVNRLVDGNQEARDLLAGLVPPPPQE